MEAGTQKQHEALKEPWKWKPGQQSNPATMGHIGTNHLHGW